MKKYNLGIDIGSISINTVILDAGFKIVREFYDYCHGRPFQVLHQRLNSIFKDVNPNGLQMIAFTGNGGKKAVEILGGIHVNEIIAQSTAASIFYPEARTIIEMGGEDSKLIFLDNDEIESKSYLSDFSMNSLCAAGTGSFLDQQAKRIGVKIEHEFGALALKSEKPPRIAGRCSVFAKSDMIHLQQIATPVHDIVAGLCFAVARNFKSTLGRGKNFELPILFQGGVAANKGMERAFREILNLSDGELIIPEYYASMGALGALHYAAKNKTGIMPFAGIGSMDVLLHKHVKSVQNILKPLEDKGHTINKEILKLQNHGELTPVFLGIDVGSLSTNVVLIDSKNNVVARRYLPTASKPIVAIQQGLREISEEVGNRVRVKGVGTTGSGRYLTGDFVGADTIQNEITAQATATIAFDCHADTIFEIGGQDSKYIHIQNGVVTDFEMNKVCAAGTGSFLEEQAERLGINIREEFETLSFKGKSPSKLGERCTVFMESDLNSLLQKGDDKENLVSGLAYSIVKNYINRVVRDKPVGDKIYFQGGVTNNKAVIAAFEEVTGKKIHIPPHFDVTGAIGAAMIARDIVSDGRQTRFRGFNVSEINYTTDKFECKACSNHCEIRSVKIAGEKPLFYGGICDKYEIDERKGKGRDIPNLFEERTRMLMDGYDSLRKNGNSTIGFPRNLMMFYQHFPYWKTFFEHLNFDVVLSDEPDRNMLSRSIEIMTCETCLPVELIHGHVLNLLDKQVDYVFLPFIVNAKGEKENPTNNCNCPWVQSNPFMVKAALNKHKDKEKLLIPTLHQRYQNTAFIHELTSFFGSKFGISAQMIKQAILSAQKAQDNFELKIRLRGREVLKNLPQNRESVVILGRPYNTGDPMLNLNLVDKLINHDIMPIPLDFLPIEEEQVFEKYPNMYWPNGQKIIAAAKYIAKTQHLNAIYLGNFRCGPDSFILHFVKDEFKGKPFLHLEVDEHSADAGMITRIEAFMDSLKSANRKEITEKKLNVINNLEALKGRTLYFPYARDVIYVFAAACRYCGYEAQVLPMQDEKDIELGRKYTNGQECFPLISTTGSFLKKLSEPGIEPAKTAFFMPDHNGPCRFGGYNKIQRILFDKLGYQDAQIIHPSNEDSYASIAPGQSNKWRKATWKGIIAVDILRMMQQVIRPYEITAGITDKLYKECLDRVVKSIETGAKDIVEVMEECARKFRNIQIKNIGRKPVVAIVGEIFMRDNPFCSSFLVERLEKLGAETYMTPFGEWVNYSTYRFNRDSKWKKSTAGILKARIQHQFQHYWEQKITQAVRKEFDLGPVVRVEDMLEQCNEYVHRDYDGDPPLAIGTAAILSKSFISGVVNILPFTCMPGTLNMAVSGIFSRNHNNIPWENFAYDGQEDSGFETRMQAFMHQVREFKQRQIAEKEIHTRM